MNRRELLRGVAASALLASVASSASAGSLALLGAGGVSSGSPPPTGFTLVGTPTTASGTTVTPPAHQAGDLIVIFAYRGGSTSAPALPSGWISILTKSGTTCSGRLGYKIATATNDASGTWTNASELVCHVYHPSAGNTAGIGASASAASTTNTVSYPALALVDPSGNSWVAGFAGCNNTAETIQTAPAGMTNESHVTGASYQGAGHDTEGGVTSWSSTNATTTGTATDSVSCTVELLLLPNNAGNNLGNLYQHVSMSGLNSAQGITCQNLKIPFPNPSGAGNCVVLVVTLPNGTTVSSITDSLGDTWPLASPTIHANAGSGNLDTFIWVLPNCSAGQRLLTLVFSAATVDIYYDVYEFYGIATSSPVTGSSSTAFAAAPSLAAGSFTPSGNNNLIFAHFGKATASGGAVSIPTRILMLGGFSSLSANIAYLATNNQAQGSALYVQGTAAAVDAKASILGDRDDWNSCAIALALSSGSGTAPTSPNGIRLDKFLSYCGSSLPATATISLQCPATGNLRVLSDPDPNITFTTITVTDSEGNTWTPDGKDAGFWYCPNCSRNDNLVVFVTDYGGDPVSSFFFWDVSGAADSPFINALQTNQAVGTTYTFSPGPDPTSGPGVVLASVGFGTGPALSVTAPSGAIWDVPNYTGKTDQDTMNNADFQAHYYYSSSGAQTWSGTGANATSSDLGGFIAFAAQ